jgi:hypothetical protein
MALSPIFSYHDSNSGKSRVREHDALKQTDAEIAAGVTPVNYAYGPDDPRRFSPDVTGLLSGLIDATAAINTVLLTNRRCHLRAGVYLIDPSVGIILQNFSQLYGDGLNNTVLLAATNGGSITDLEDYVKGSVIKRSFTLGVANPYVFGCCLRDFAVILRHPAYNAANYKQIAVDLRNITRATCERVYVGNEQPTADFPVTAVPSATDRCQGYGFVIGTRGASDTEYCGGEVNTLRDCYAWGCFKPIVIDDSQLSPSSAAHATVLDNCDVQHGHELVTQAQQYAAGVIVQNLTMQANDRQSGNANPTVGLSLSGYNGKAHVKYAEMGIACDVLFGFSSTSKNNEAHLGYYSSSAPSTATITDSGSNNWLKYPAPVLDTAPTPDVTTGFGNLVEYFNQAYRTVLVKFVGSSAAVQGTAIGVSVVTRNSTGDYTLTISPAMPDAHWIPNIEIHTDGSNHNGGVSIVSGSQSASSVRFVTYSQNGATTTQIDPSMVYFTGTQI